MDTVTMVALMKEKMNQVANSKGYTASKYIFFRINVINSSSNYVTSINTLPKL